MLTRKYNDQFVQQKIIVYVLSSIYQAIRDLIKEDCGICTKLAVNILWIPVFVPLSVLF